MVANTDQDGTNGFPGRLKEALRDNHPDTRGQAPWLAKKMDITQQAAEKWIKGASRPQESRWVRLADQLKVNVAWLRDGVGEKKRTVRAAMDAQSTEMFEIWEGLHPPDRSEVIKYAKFRLGEQPAAAKKPRSASKGS